MFAYMSFESIVEISSFDSKFQILMQGSSMPPAEKISGAFLALSADTAKTPNLSPWAFLTRTLYLKAGTSWPKFFLSFMKFTFKKVRLLSLGDPSGLPEAMR